MLSCPALGGTWTCKRPSALIFVGLKTLRRAVLVVNSIKGLSTLRSCTYEAQFSLHAERDGIMRL